MSNRVDVFVGEENLLAVPAGRGIVFVDGVVSSSLEVLEVVGGGWGEFGFARFAFNGLPEEVERACGMGKAVRVEVPYDAGVGAVQVEGLCVFAGQVEKIDTLISADSERVEVTAFDYAARLSRVTVYGQRVGELFLAGREAVFNAGGIGNASKDIALHEGKSYRVFAVDGGDAKEWSLAEIIVYLLSEYLRCGSLGVPCVEQLEGLSGFAAAGEIDVEGLSLLAALEKCCNAGGVRFRFEGVNREGGPGERIVFYVHGKGRSVELNHQRYGEAMSVSRTNICRVESEREYYPVTRRYVGRGGWKRYEAVFELASAWDSSMEGLGQGEYSQSASSDFETVRDVYRRWCLNEAGDYAGQAFDFGSLFEGAEYLQRRRSFVEVIGFEVSYDSGTSWFAFEDSYTVLDDECGVWISDDALSAEMWTAIGAGTLKFRVRAAVESDERLTVTVADGPVGSCAEVVDCVIDAGKEFAYYKRADSFASVDDGEALHAYVRDICERNRAVIETIDVETTILGLHYNCGDRVVYSADSRDVLGIRRDSRSEFVIESVVMDFAKQMTRLRIERRR